MIITQQESLLSVIYRFLTEEGVQTYLVGGAVRDMLLGRETNDIDIALNGDAFEIALKVADKLGGTHVPLDDINRVARVVINEKGKYFNFDFSSLKGSNINEDLAERDFTINALAVELNESTAGALSFNKNVGARCFVPISVIDPFDGQRDLKNRVIRMINSRVFTADSARLLRAVRLAAELGFAIDKETEVQIKKDARLIAGVAGERLHEELVKTLAVPGSAALLKYMDELGLLTVLVPELEPARETTQPVEHVWKVLEHSLNTAAAVEFLLRRGQWLYGRNEILEPVPWSDKLAEHFAGEVSSGSTRFSLLKLAALFHDIAKPQTKSLAEDDRVRFLGHDKDGALITAEVMERLRFSTREINYVVSCVRYHMRPTQLTHEELPTNRALYRYFRETGDAAFDILFLSLADHLAARGETLNLEMWREHAKLVEYIISQYYNTQEIIRPPKLIDGYDLINKFGIKPGPVIGEILEAVREAQAAGEITDRSQALEFVRKKLQT